MAYSASRLISFERFRSLLPLLALILIVLALWVPVGFRTLGIAEEWGFYSLASRGIPLVPASVWNPEHVLRPFVALPFGFGYWLTPDSFIGLNLVMMLTFMGKALSFYALLRLLVPIERSFAFIAAALFVLYPADSITMMMRAVNIHFALLLSLLALNFLVLYWRNPRWYFLIGLWLCLIVGLGTYELVYVVTFFAPLLLLVHERRLSRKFIKVTLLCYLPLFIFLAWYLITFASTNDLYQIRYVERMSLGTPGELVDHMFHAVLHVIDWHFYTGWGRALTGFNVPINAIIGIGAALLVMAVGWLQIRKDSRNSLSKKPALLLGIGIAGVLITLVGFLPYAFTGSNFFSTERVFYFTAAGGALSITALLYLLFRYLFRSRMGFILGGSIIVGIAMAGMLYQHEYYADWSREQQRLMGGIIENIPRITDNGATVIVYMDFEPNLHTSSPEYRHPLFLHYRIFADAIGFIYDNLAPNFIICSPSQDNVDPEICDKTITDTPPEKLILLKYSPISGRIVILNAIPGHPSDGYNPEALIDRNAPPPERAHTILAACWPVERCYPPPGSTVSNEFDEWGFGAGWRGPEITPDGLTFQWTISPEATIQLPSLVEAATYHFETRVVYSALPDIFDSLQLQVNGHPVAMSRGADETGATVFQAVIPGGFLEQPINDLQFTTGDPVVPEGGFQALGIAFDWVHLEASSP